MGKNTCDKVLEMGSECKTYELKHKPGYVTLEKYKNKKDADEMNLHGKNDR